MREEASAGAERTVIRLYGSVRYSGDGMTSSFTMVGLPDAAVRESRERIRASISMTRLRHLRSL
ncbi:MAG TPA: hypothetical protein VJQ56_14890 [Blastocatellia bacterium]|nr:hypothetical protein [Blastocatellia bacterium]